MGQVYSDIDERLETLRREADEADRRSQELKENGKRMQEDVTRLKKLSDRVQRRLATR